MATTNQFLIDGLPITDTVAFTVISIKNGGQSDYLPINQSVKYVLIPNPNRLVVSDSVTMFNVVTEEAWRGSAAEATVAESIGINRDSVRAVVDPLAIGQFVSYFLGSYSWVNPAVPTPSPPGHLTLSSGGTSVALRKPDFGDADSYDPYRVSRQNRGGDLQIFQDPMWPTTEILDFKFSFLDPTVVEGLLDFLVATLGQQVQLVDHLGRTWQGFVITPAGEVVQDKRTTSTAAFKFQPMSGPS